MYYHCLLFIATSCTNGELSWLASGQIVKIVNRELVSWFSSSIVNRFWFIHFFACFENLLFFASVAVVTGTACIFVQLWVSSSARGVRTAVCIERERELKPPRFMLFIVATWTTTQTKLKTSICFDWVAGTRHKPLQKAVVSYCSTNSHIPISIGRAGDQISHLLYRRGPVTFQN